MKHSVYEIYKKSNPNHNYIGIHSTNDLDDGYMGSGIKLNEAYLKHGKEQFEKKILVITQDRDEAFRIEAGLVESKNPYYNISPGGIGNGVGENHPSWGNKYNVGRKRPDLAERNKTRFNLGKKRPRQSELMKDPNKNPLLTKDCVGKNNGRYRKDISDERILYLLSEGYSVSNISKELNVSYNTIKRRIGGYKNNGAQE